MAEGAFISYFRVSTDKQGRSGLGLAAQRQAVTSYLNGGRWTVLAEFVEVESGRNAARPELAKALAACRVHRVPLVVAKVDRLTRSLAFLSRLLESGVEVRFCDLPQIEGPTGRFMLQQMASVAELEAGLIADRTRKALAAAKERGTKLGGLRVSNGGGVIPAGESPRFTPDDTAKSLEVRRAAAKGRAADLLDTLEAIRAEGITTARGIAQALTARGIPTARGGAVWQAVQVQRLLAYAASPAA